MKIFPHILSRIGGETFDIWGEVDLSELNDCIASVTNSQKQRKINKELLTSDLLDYNRTLTDTKQQNLLQNFRRDIFNERPIKLPALESCRSLLTNELRSKVDDYLQLVDRHAQALSQYNKVFNKTLIECRKHLQTLSRNENLQKGLLLSSRSLFDSLNGFRLTDAARFRNKETRVEESLIKYMTRITTKTSPFSTFNNLAPAALVGNSNNPIQIKTIGSASVISKVQLNNNIYQYLRDLFMAWRPFFMQLYLRPNPTIIYNSDHYLFLTNSRNNEAFQRIPLNPVISYLLELVSEFPEGIRFRDLLSTMIEDIDATAEELEAHIKKLLELGLIEYDFGVSGVDPNWDRELIKKLKTFATADAPLVIDLIDTLQHLREIGNEIGLSDSAGRGKRLNQAYEMLHAICMKIHEAAGLPEHERKESEAPKEKPVAVERNTDPGKINESTSKPEQFHHWAPTHFYFKPEQIFYEDTVREVTPEIDESMLNDVIGAFAEIVNDCRIFNFHRTEREKIASFLHEIDAGKVPIPLLTFYELYSRETRKQDEGRQIEEDERKKHGANEPLPNVLLRAPASTQKRFALMRDWSDQLWGMMTPIISEATHEVQLTRHHMKELTAAVGLESGDAPDPNSFSIFVQLFVDRNANGEPKLKGVLNSNISGYGKMLSRFLSLFPQNVVDDIREWNKMIGEDDDLFIEDTDASFFNANLHPPLLPYEIRTPGGHNMLPPQNQLPLSDFVVTIDERTDTPLLIHKPTNKRSFVFDLGFQGPLGRSALFRVLSKFSAADFPGVSSSLQTINNLSESKQPSKDRGGKRVIRRPRIVYEDKIVIQRKGWLIDKDILPSRKPNEDDPSYYLRIQEWREANGIDAHVFVCANPTLGNTQNDDGDMRKLGKDDYKPQFIDLKNPVFINLFEKLMEKVPKVLKIEEMLPSPDHLLKIGNERFVSEFIVHWYNFKYDARSSQSVAANVAVNAG